MNKKFQFRIADIFIFVLANNHHLIFSLNLGLMTIATAIAIMFRSPFAFGYALFG